MSLVVNPYAYFTDTNGDALNGYLYIGEAGKNAENYPIAIYYDALLTTPAPNPLTVSAGYIYNGGTIAQIYASVDYSLIAKTTGGSLVYSSLNESGMTNGAIGTIDEMKEFVAPYNNYALNVLGYSEAGDGGGGLFYYDANSTEDDNGGTIIEPTSGSGRWKRSYDYVLLEYFGVESPDYVLDSNWTWDATVDKSTANLGTIIDPSVALDEQGTGSGLGCMIRQYSGAVNVKWFGAKGDCVNDDTSTFIAAVTYCKNTNQVLDISESRLYLSSLSSSIDISNLEIIGNGKGCSDYEDWPYMAGTDSFASHLASYQSSNSLGASAIISNYNGAVFTGTTFFVRGVSIYCNPTKTSSSGFVQSTPTTYPGWSNALDGDYKGTLIRFCGSYGIYLKGGLETASISNLGISNCIDNCLRVGQTAGINSPIEYLTFERCSFVYSNQDNVVFDSANKEIVFRFCCLNGPGRPMKDSGGAATYDAIKYGIKISPIIAFNGLKVEECYAEECQGLVRIVGGYVIDCNITNNICYYHNASWLKFLFATTASVHKNLYVRGNSFNMGLSPLYIHQLTSESYMIDVKEPYNSPITIGNYIDNKCLVPYTMHRQLETSRTIGNGTAGTFTYTISRGLGDNGELTNTPIGIYLITANWQATNFTGFGAYLMTITKLSNGNIYGTTLAFGSTTGFTSAPTVSTSGVISLSLAQYYRGSVIRLDASEVSHYSTGSL